METFFFILRIVLIFSVLFIERKRPGEALLWVVLFALFPVAGLFLYLIFGSTVSIKISRTVRGRTLREPYERAIKEQITQLGSVGCSPSLSEDESRMVAFNIASSEAGIGFFNRAEIYTTAQSHYQVLFEDIEKAQDHIHVAFYAIHNDHVGRKLMEALIKKAQEGVKVRVLCDGLSGLGAWLFLFPALKRAGGEARLMKTLLTQFRYHRKIVVVDGRVGYTGGMNIGVKYLGENPKKSPWRDTQIRLEGDSVAELQACFLYDWVFANWTGDRMEPDVGALFPEPEVSDELPCQIVVSGIEMENRTVKLSYTQMISLARKRIVFQTPYFIPGDTFLDAIRIALGSGVEVVVQIPNQPSNLFLDSVTRYFLAQLVPLGLKVMCYNGYVHSKAVRVDDTITCIGSVNIDNRSLDIDDEICAIFYSKKFAERYDAVLAEDFRNSHEMNYKAFQDRGLWPRFCERFFFLFSAFM